MSWFPFHYRDIKAFSDDNLPLSTASNEAAKLFDSAITQLALHDNDPVFGNLEQAMTEAAIFTSGRSRIIDNGKIRPLADYQSRSQLFNFFSISNF